MASYDALVVAIRSRIDAEALFAEFAELEGHGSERRAKCVFHEDSTPSMSVNVEEGLYCCHVPDCGAHGDFIDFYMRVRSLKFSEAVQELARRVGLRPDDYNNTTPGLTANVEELNEREARLLETFVPGSVPAIQTRRVERGPEKQPDRFIDEQIIDTMHTRLLNTPSLLDYLETRRGLTVETVVRFKLGHDGKRFYIPVRDEDGRCVNVRRYKPDAHRAQDKMLSWREGFGSARLFPLWLVNDDAPIWLFEGEMDCLLARQMGLNAITTTGGAGTWRDSWNVLFKNRDVVICYDADDAGKTGARAIANKLFGEAKSIRVMNIPLAEPPGADFTDYIVGHGHTIADFLALLETTPNYQSLGERTSSVAAMGEPEVMHLSHASRSEYYNLPVKFNVMVSGKTTAPFLIPREVRMSCSMPGVKMCDYCPVAAAGGKKTHRLEFDSNEVLQFTNVATESLNRGLKAKTGVPVKCGYVKADITEAMNIESVQIIPEIERSDAEAPYVTREAFFMGHGIQANRSYVMTGITVPEPKRQLATHLIHSAIMSQSNIDAFKLTEDVVNRLRIFQPSEAGVQGLWRQVGRLYDDLERFLRVYQRRDLILSVDMIFHSVLQFRFQGELLKRGWMEALIIGDSRTGKTTIVQRLLDYYGAGEFTTGENTSLAGLVGGLHQIGTSWALQWGRIPLNDRRLLVIDEAGNLPQEQIARLSSMRSSGIAEIVKVHTERTNARTRQVWISNPRSPRPLSSFSQGVLAVKELIGAPEDIARFDLVVSAASGDVPLAVVNAERAMETPEVFGADLCHQRVMWAWSRTSDQVVWADGSTEAVLRLATEQGERYRYATEIPLVEPNEQRVKLARAAVSVACQFFSASDDGQCVIVRPEHVEFAAAFLESLYAKPSMSFDEYAAAAKRRYVLVNSGEVDRIMRRDPNSAQAMMESETFTQRDLEEILGYDDRAALRQVLTTLREAGFLRRVGSSFYVKTPAAIRWLRRELSGDTSDAVDLQSFMDGPAPERPDF